MKVILYMATTLNGLIAKTNDDTSWISKAEWDSYSAMVKKAGNMIVGHRTYNIITTQPEFADLKDVTVTIVSTQEFELVSPNHRIAHSPKEALESSRDFETVIVAGGGILNSAFLAQNLVDEIYVDIEPAIFGQGLPLCNGLDFDRRLKLLDLSKLSEDEIQLHYQVIQ